MKKILLIILFWSSFSTGQTIGISPFATGLNNVVDIASNSVEPNLYVVQKNGLIRVVDANGVVNPTPFLDISSLITTAGNEQGLLGMAFHPDYAILTGYYFYVNYTRAGDGATVIARYSLDLNSTLNVADPASAVVLMVIPQPFANHNGGSLKFGSDNMLYIGMGDGGSGGDPGNRAQDINENLGKLLRIGVEDVTVLPYYIPPTNPFAGDIPGNDEIWSIGLRNPWKFSFDRLTGELWVADVGQNQREEINRVAPLDPNINYGWKCYEGTAVFSTCTAPAEYEFPLAEYTHAATGGCSITGGYVYRGSTYQNFTGKYFFADYCLNRLGVVTQQGAVSYSSTFAGNNNFTTFGQDKDGELYVGAQSGTIYRIIDTSLSLDNVSGSNFALFPNPASEEVFIKGANGYRNLKIFDISGKLLQMKDLIESENTPVDTSTLTSGIYLVTIEDASGNKLTSKLTIQ